MSSKLIYAWVPGLPHILRPELSKSYAALNKGCLDLAAEFERAGVKRVLYYSTQWLSVLGQSVQAKPRVSGLHVDENWYEIANLKFDFTIDVGMANALVEASRAAGMQARSVNYEGFPVDTGTIVADRLINKKNVPVGMYSCCVYSDHEETKRIGTLARDVANKLDGVTAIVAVSGLSGRYFTTEIDHREDHIRDPKDDEWNKRVLKLAGAGQWNELRNIRDECAKACKVDMGLKALSFLDGAGLCDEKTAFKTLAYDAVYGTGNAVLVSCPR
jgi:2-aminophenol/2-amino-5-chlorophenol 1,6-dioxygenase alpha subunit